MTKLYLEDLAVGMQSTSGEIEVTAAAIKAFATQFDPQPFHLDEHAARASIFGGLVASGWHTAAMTMKLIVAGGVSLADGTVGAGVEELKWITPVHPGDRLHIVSEVVDFRPMKSKPGFGLARLRTLTRNQDNAVVQSMMSTVVVPRRPV